MRSPKRQGFTLIELLVVIAIIAILASILFPVFAKAREKARQTTCTSQVRQLATAVQMYTQDNGSRYPGFKWNTAIENYVGSQKIFFCPSDAANDKNAPISYGYGGLLVRADDSNGTAAAANTGVNEAQISAPTEIGVIADATPSRAWADGGGLVGGGALIDPANAASNNAVELDPRHGGVIVGFADGHAKFFPGKQVNLKDMSYGPARAFYHALGLGMISNYGGGLQKITGTAALSPVLTNTVSVGGDSATMPIIMAAAEAWAGYGGKWYSRGFKGCGDVQNTLTTTAKFQDWRRAIASGHYCWGVADGATPAGATQMRIGYDCFVFIVSKNCKITTGSLSTNFDINSATAQSIFSDATYKGYSANVYQAYTYDSNSGSRKYAQSVIGAAIQTQAQVVVDDKDMVEKVAADPYGLGYCSSAFADTDKVTILNVNGKIFPNQNPKYRWIVRDTVSGAATPGEFEYPLVRTLRVIMAGNGGANPATAGQFATIFGDAEFQNGPLFKASYWAN